MDGRNCWTFYVPMRHPGIDEGRDHNGESKKYCRRANTLAWWDHHSIFDAQAMSSCTAQLPLQLKRLANLCAFCWTKI
jgi:hypothetical protein